jgi:hypothetical protein
MSHHTPIFWHCLRFFFPFTVFIYYTSGAFLSACNLRFSIRKRHTWGPTVPPGDRYVIIRNTLRTVPQNCWAVGNYKPVEDAFRKLSSVLLWKVYPTTQTSFISQQSAHPTICHLCSQLRKYFTKSSFSRIFAPLLNFCLHDSSKPVCSEPRVLHAASLASLISP